MSLNDVTINKVTGGLGRRFPLTDMVSGLLANGAALPGALLDTVYKLQSVDDALAMGLDAAYDESMGILVYEHIKEFFRMNPNGTLWFMMVSDEYDVSGTPTPVTFAMMLDPTLTNYAKKLLIGSGGEINQLAVAFNPVTPVTTDVQLLAAVAKAQLLVDAEYALHRPLHVILEGKGFTSTTITDLRDLAAPGVSVMVGQSKAVHALNAAYDKYAAVGTALGAISKAAVNESISWVQKFNVLGDNLQDFAIDGVASASLTPSLLSDINDAGYLFFLNHANFPGIYFNDSHTADVVTSDFCYIENNRTINKATRLIRQAMLPYLNSPVQVNPTTGYIDPVVVKAMEAAGQKAIEEGMSRNSELSGFVFTINEQQNILSSSELASTLELIPTGSARKISIKIGFSNPFNA